MTPENYGTRTGLEMHHWNWRAFHGSGTAMVTSTSTNGAEWIEVGGHRMTQAGRRRDKGRDVWTAGSFKGTGAVHGRIMIRGKIYTFTIPRTGGVVYAINLHGSSKHGSGKPTNKPTSKPSGAADSKNLYGQEHGGDQEGSTPETGSAGGQGPYTGIYGGDEGSLGDAQEGQTEAIGEEGGHENR
jgi:hypothetical protein